MNLLYGFANKDTTLHWLLQPALSAKYCTFERRFVLQDPTFLIPNMLFLLAIIVAIVLFLIQRERKEMAYAVISDTPMVSVQKDVADQVAVQVQVLFRQKPVNDVHLVILDMWNSGNKPIEEKDYTNNTTVTFPLGAKVNTLDVSILSTRPDSLKTDVKLDHDLQNISLSPLLLNRKDLISLRILLTDYQGKLSVSARISGISQLRDFNHLQANFFYRVYKVLPATLLFSAISFTGWFLTTRDVGVAFSGALFTFLLISILAGWKKLFDWLEKYG